MEVINRVAGSFPFVISEGTNIVTYVLCFSLIAFGIFMFLMYITNREGARHKTITTEITGEQEDEDETDEIENA